MLVVRRLAPVARRPALEPGHKAGAVALQGDLEAETLEDRRHQVDLLGERLDRKAADRARAWIDDDQRHVESLRKEAFFAEQPVVAQHLAVVGGEQDQGPFDLGAGLERLDDPADMVVDLGDQAVVERAGLAEVGLVQAPGLPYQLSDLGCTSLAASQGCAGASARALSARTGGGTQSGS